MTVEPASPIDPTVPADPSVDDVDDLLDDIEPELLTATALEQEWWRSAVIYQIYPRSFADASGDGIGDLPGILERIPALSELGVDAIWLSPFYRSPQKDAGYDVADYCDVDPLFGTLDDFDRMLDAAHTAGLKVIADIVPNHTSDASAWFQEALAAAPGSAERARYLFRDGRGQGGDEPPNNWQSVFGGPAWERVTESDGTPGQWYLHLFDASQPDLDWTNPWVHERFEEVLRFWLDRGVDGFRVDVAHGLVKVEGLPDWTPAHPGGPAPGHPDTTDDDSFIDSLTAGAFDDTPYWAQDGVHEIWREWRRVVDEYDGRMLVAEAWVEPLTKLARWVRDDEMHQAFNFSYLESPWSPNALTAVIEDSLQAFGGVGAPSTWVLSNHDTVRHATRLSLEAGHEQGSGVGPRTTGVAPYEVGLHRARAATALMLALPGSAYLYQGEELGLPEVVDIPDAARQDPTFLRTNGERYGRDGCRVPIPWESDAPAYGFNTTGASWLPQPSQWAELARDRQRGVPGSTLEFYRLALRLRREYELGTATLTWSEKYGADAVGFTVGDLTVVTNVGAVPVELTPGEGEVLLASGELDGATLPPDTTVWLRG